MKRGIVLSIENKKAVVMTADGQFISIPHQAHMRVGDEASIPAETAAPPRRKPKRVYWYSGAAAAILLFFIPFFYLTTAEAHPVVAYVSLDINPSIEMGVDQQQRVQELIGLNRDGQAIVSKISYKGKSVDTVAASIMSTVAAEHYLDKPDKDIVITSYMLEDKSPGEELEKTVTSAVDQKIQEAIKGIDAAKEPNVTVLSVPSEVREEASANGISSGKMAVYLMAKDEGYPIELEQIKSQSLAEATKSVGGVKKIVEKGVTKEKLKELAVKEKQNNSQATATPVADKAASSQGGTALGATINKTAPVKPTEGPLKHPNRPSHTEKPSWSRENNPHKPSIPAKPVSPSKPSGSDQNKWQSGNWPKGKNNSDKDRDDDRDDEINSSDKDNSVNGSSKLEKWTWRNEDNHNDDEQGDDRIHNRNDNKKDNDREGRSNNRDK
ncbi:anti-sigma factor-like protein [Paenibacillus sp. BK033]|uniref:anti-sigma factor domain-containing protein n=1 Tax=Paenibacillus sp. BK033 TaxID=2512133 RepID=UPI001044E10A|nr:anti-sigma factor domain-containing protein [Paenibacillus sp. BK033]TCN00723.1 anti-sigma factor-like protein [Paenibacillus sp. BK033]